MSWGAKKAKASRANTVAVVAIVLCVAVAFCVWQLMGSGSGVCAVVHDGDGGTTVVQINQGSAPVTTTIETSLGTNVVESANGGVYVSSADCENHDCMKQGAISKTGQQIVCLPHKLWIEITDDASQASSKTVEEAAAALGYDTVSS